MRMCDKMTCSIKDIFLGGYLNRIDYAKHFTDFADDVFLSFSNKKHKLVTSHVFLMPFLKIDGNLKRIKNWQQPIENWCNTFYKIGVILFIILS